MTGAPGQDARIPVTVVTGCLGAGKTTLVNHLLSQTHDRRIVVIVNEFGEAGIDGDLIADTGLEDLIELSSGCVCCVVRGDLIRTLRDLHRRVGRVDAVVIETTGLANPAPVIQTFSADQILAARFRLDSVVTVVDALHVTSQIATNSDAADQIALADCIVLNKASEAADIPALRSQLCLLNPFARIITADRGQVMASDLLDCHGFDLDRLANRMPVDPPQGHDRNHGHSHDHIANHGITSVTLRSADPIESARLESWLTELLARQGPDILRIKGTLCTGTGERLILQAVHMMVEADGPAPWPEGSKDKASSRLVLIGRHLDEKMLQLGFDACTLRPHI